MKITMTTFEGIAMAVPQFAPFCKDESYEYDKKIYWLFDCSMVSTCEPLFDDCKSNYEVERKLRAAKVILTQNNADSEACALVVRFSSLASANKFIERLNTYLVEQARRLLADSWQPGPSERRIYRMNSSKYLAVTAALKALSQAYNTASQTVANELRDMIKEDGDNLIIDDDSLADMLSNAFYGLSAAVYKSLKDSEVKRIG